MDKYKIINDIRKSIQELDEIEKNYAMINLCRIQRQIEEIKKMQIEQVNTPIIQYANMYGIKKEAYEEQIKNISKEYLKSIEEVINTYYCFYFNVVKMKEEAINNQKIAIANIITLINRQKGDNAENGENQNNIRICVEKKLNYGVIVSECDAKIEWIIKEIEEWKTSLKSETENKIIIYKENRFVKIIKKLINKIKGKKEFRNFIAQYKKDKINKIEERNANNLVNISLTFAGTIKQIKKANHQIKIANIV